MDTSAPEFFENKYRDTADFWHFAESRYELARYDAIVQALAGRRYSRAFEPGSSVGVLTEKLADICDHIDACDFAPTAVALARERCSELTNVSIETRGLSEKTNFRSYDLVVFSEIGYYFSAQALAQIATNLTAPMPPGGTFLAAHWLGDSPDHILCGDEVHAVLRACKNLKLRHEERFEGFRLDRWERA